MADLPNPKYRKERYLYNIASGTTSELPQPKSREERYLYEIANNGGGGGGTTNYNQLSNKPKVNNVELSGNKTTRDLIPIGNGLNFNEDGELEATGGGSGAVDSVNGKTGVVVLDAEDVGALPDDTDIPDSLSDLTDDSTHRTVTDTEKSTWNGKSDFSGNYNDLSNKPSIPSNTSDLTNDSGFITNTVNNLLNYYLKSETYTQAEVNALISAIVTLDIQAVSTLPTEDISRTTIYLVPSADPQTQNIKDEYINLDGTSSGWELIGSTEIDLSGYVTDTELTTALADYVTTTSLNTTLAGYIQKSQTPGLVKNDGTIDTNQYLTQHQDISSKQNKTLDAPILVESVQQTTVEGALNAINNKSGSGGVTDFDDLTNRPQESDTIDISELDLPMPAKPSEYPVLFDETGTEYQAGWYKRASDGKVKPVWRKCFYNLVLLQNNAYNYFAHSILNIENVVKFDGLIHYTNTEIYSIGYRNSDFSSYLEMDGTNIKIYNRGWTNKPVSVNVYYTKTTDEWKEV